MKKAISIAAIALICAICASAQNISSEKWFVEGGASALTSMSGSLEKGFKLKPIDAGAQIEVGRWFAPQVGVAVNLRGGYVVTSSIMGGFFTNGDIDASAQARVILDLTNIISGSEEGTRKPIHFGAYAGAGVCTNMRELSPIYSAGLEANVRVAKKLKVAARVGGNSYDGTLAILPEASIGVRYSLGKGGKSYASNPESAYVAQIEDLQNELKRSKEIAAAKTDTVVVTRTVEVPVTKVVRDTVSIIKNVVDTLTIYDVVEIPTDRVDVKVKIDTIPIFIKPHENKSSNLYIYFPENDSEINYGARKSLQKLAEEINAYEGELRYLVVTPIPYDCEDPQMAFSLAEKRSATIRTFLTNECGVDTAKLLEVLATSESGTKIEDGNAFCYIAREDDKTIFEVVDIQ